LDRRYIFVVDKTALDKMPVGEMTQHLGEEEKKFYKFSYQHVPSPVVERVGYQEGPKGDGGENVLPGN
jgi:hypothetical protein